MEHMQDQLGQLTQAMQALVANRNPAPVEELNSDDLAEDEEDANPFAVLGRNWPRDHNAQPSEERWEWRFKTEIWNSAGDQLQRNYLTGSQPYKRFWNSKMFPLISVFLY